MEEKVYAYNTDIRIQSYFMAHGFGRSNQNKNKVKS